MYLLGQRSFFRYYLVYQTPPCRVRQFSSSPQKRSTFSLTLWVPLGVGVGGREKGRGVGAVWVKGGGLELEAPHFALSVVRSCWLLDRYIKFSYSAVVLCFVFGGCRLRETSRPYWRSYFIPGVYLLQLTAGLLPRTLCNVLLYLVPP